MCKKEYKAQIYQINNGTYTKCKSCANKIRSTKHGENRSRLHSIWCSIITRCYNENDASFKHYGARGIIMCFDWRNDYVNFSKWAKQNGYKDNLSIDRINNDGNYEPSNCRWVNQNIQTQNCRVIRSSNKSGYRGVSWDKKSNKWRSQIQVNKQKKHLGFFDNKIDAAIAYDNYVIKNKLAHSINSIQQLE